MNDYRKMWEELGLDLNTHDAVLETVGKMYQETFLSQKQRPKSMEYFDFVVKEIHGLRIKELLDAKKEGKKIIGTFCVFVPEEIILALNSISIGLCAGAELGSDASEEYIPRNTCSLIKSAFEFKLLKVCPYIESTDMIVGENTCDGKKKAYESYKNIVNNMYVMDIPQMKMKAGYQLLKSEYLRFTKALEELTGKKLTVENLKKSIKIVNNKREALDRLNKLRSNKNNLISGLDSLLINQIYFYDDPERFTKAVNELCDEIEKNKTQSLTNNKARILLSGCPMAIPNWKIPNIIETSGAIIVGEEMCTGERGIRNLVSTNAETTDKLIDNIVDRYMKINCSVFTPNENRLEDIKEMVKKYNADGVIHYALQFCQPYSHEAISYRKKLEEENIPFLNIETDYSQEDTGQIKTRIEAFIERIKD